MTTRIADDRYRDARFLVQGDYVIAVNESCAVIGNGPERRVTVSFFSYRWDVLDETKAKMHADLLKARLDDMHRSELDEHTLAELADVCLGHYRLGEEQGWLKEIKPRHLHDCPECIFLGPASSTREYVPKDGRTTYSDMTDVDLYYCPKERPHATVIARYGSEGHEYKSGILFGMFGMDDDLKEAYQRASLTGLINGLVLPRMNAIDQGDGGINADSFGGE